MPPSAAVINLKDPSNRLPEWLFVDTCVLLGALAPRHTGLRRSAEAEGLLRLIRSAALQGTAYAITSVHVVEECFFKIIQAHLVRETMRQQRPSRQWHRLYKEQPSLINACTPSLRAFYHKLVSIPISVLDPSDLAKSSPSCPELTVKMVDWIDDARLLPADALLLSEAERIGIHNIATIDTDFTRAQGFTIYGYGDST